MEWRKGFECSSNGLGAENGIVIFRNLDIYKRQNPLLD